MLRIRNEARVGLRGVAFGFIAAVFTLSSHPAQCAPYADIVVDANTGNVLHATNPDALRHPASLTKIMTLYMLFEQLEAGKLKLDSKLKVSEFAAGQSPTKLGLRPGSTIQVEDAIKGIVTRSANDAAVVVAEAIADSEQAFAKLMTSKAQTLGMSRTVYRNASGLPNDEQVTTARDQSILGRAIQERFPRYYKYFSTRSFTFRGNSIGNHNNLLGRVDGVDGIKTGYTQASGFNLVTSVHRGNRYLIAVVLGGNSANSRDARMRELISEKIALASVKRTAPAADGPDAPELKVATAKVEAKPDSKAERKPEQKGAATSGFGLASAHTEPVRFTPTSEPAQTRTAPARAATGSTEPIRPVLVKTLMVRAPGTQAASLTPALVPTAAQPSASPAKSAELTPNAEPIPEAEARAEPESEARSEPPAAVNAPPSRLLEPVQVISEDSMPGPASEPKAPAPTNELKTVAAIVPSTSSFTRGPALPAPKIVAPAPKSDATPKPPSTSAAKSEPASKTSAPAKSEPSSIAVASALPSTSTVAPIPAASPAPKLAASTPKGEPAAAAPATKGEPASTAVASVLTSAPPVTRGPALPPAPKVAALTPKGEPAAAAPAAKSEPASTAVASVLTSAPPVTRGPAPPPAPKVAVSTPKSEPVPAPTAAAPTPKIEPAPMAAASIVPSTSTFTRGPAVVPPQKFMAPATRSEPGPMAFAAADPMAAAAPSALAPKQARTGWIIQVGAYPAEQEAKQRLSVVQSKASKILTHADPFTETVDKGGTTLYRARFAGLDKDSAEAACKYLKRNDVECVAIKN